MTTEFFPESLVAILYQINTALVLITVIFLILENRDSQTSIIWILVIILIPFAGLLAYLIIGRTWKRRRLVKNSAEKVLSAYRKRHRENHQRFLRGLEEEDSELSNDLKKITNLLFRSSMASLSFCHSPDLFFSGEEFFGQLLKDLRQAEKSIHMDFFIWKSDKLGQRVAQVLEAKARQGVQVKLIFDGLGSLRRISRSYRRRLKAAGISYHYFMDLRHWKSQWRINYNNHKKIVIIDGKIGYLGGMNLGQEYIDGGKFASWRDTQMRLTGSAVALLENAFLIDWSNCLGEHFPKDQVPDLSQEMGTIPLQIGLSGPDSRWSSLKLSYFTLITNANQEVLIQSPYFVPDNSIMEALIAAALGGVRVELMITGVPDKYSAWWAAHSYFIPLLEAGVHIYLYQPGFLHAKVFVVDSTISSVGTCNMDIRSFFYHYEISALIYNRRTARKLRDQYLKDRLQCHEVTLEEMKNLGLLKRFRNSFMRIFSPLL